MCLPLIALLRKNIPFDWTAACQNAFAGLKAAITTAPCLALPDASEDAAVFELVCNAFGFGLGAVLMKSDRPIALWSRKMVPAELSYHVTEQELLAVIDARCRCYVDGVPFTPITSQTHSLAHNLLCPHVRRAGVNICNASTLHGHTDLAGPMLLILSAATRHIALLLC